MLVLLPCHWISKYFHGGTNISENSSSVGVFLNFPWLLSLLLPYWQFITLTPSGEQTVGCQVGSLTFPSRNSCCLIRLSAGSGSESLRWLCNKSMTPCIQMSRSLRFLFHTQYKKGNPDHWLLNPNHQWFHLKGTFHTW